MHVEQLKAELSVDEGRRKKPYDDATGKELKPGDVVQGFITIGVGINLSAGLTDEEIDYLLENRIGRAMAELDANVPWWRDMADGPQRGLVNMLFNMGWPDLAHFKKMLAALKAGDYREAARQAMRNSADDGPSKWAQQVGERADRIEQLFLEGVSHESV